MLFLKPTLFPLAAIHESIEPFQQRFRHEWSAMAFGFSAGDTLQKASPNGIATVLVSRFELPLNPSPESDMLIVTEIGVVFLDVSRESQENSVKRD